MATSYDYAYTLRKTFEAELPEITQAHIYRDGLSLTDKEKPFLTVQYVTPQTEIMSAGRDSFRRYYTYQVGLFARDINEQYRLEAKMRDVIEKPRGYPLRYYDEVAGEFVTSEGTNVELTEGDYVPMYNDDSAQQSLNNHGYFDVIIEEV